MDMLNFKYWYYEVVQVAGITDIPCDMTLDEIPDRH